jgi:hypothetical protein
MRIIGIDPGKTVGMVLYDTVEAKVIDAIEGKGEGALLSIRDFVRDWVDMDKVKAIAIEWPRIYSKAGNDVADTCIQAGMLWWMLGARTLPHEGLNWSYQKGVYLHTVTRQQVVKFLGDTMGQPVRTDAGVWSALVQLHGGAGVADKRTTKKERGGPLAELIGKPHAKAALAVAWAVANTVDTDGRVK